MSLHGVLVIDKPRGLSSAQVVARVRRELREKSAGHTGTLDPMATGVLPVVMGEGTKIAGFLLADDKAYEGELELGVTTDTLDAEGKEVARAPWQHVDEAAVRAAIARLTGEQLQVPPMYSALKQDGKRLYELARAGQEVPREARPVRIDRFDLRSFAPPRLTFAVDCSKGTYVRSLARDLGEILGTGATLTALRRTRSGRFSLADAVPLDGDLKAAVRDRLVSPAAAIDHLPAWTISEAEAARVAQGQRLPLPADATPGQIWRILRTSGDLAAVAEARMAEGGPEIDALPVLKMAYLRVMVPG
jgi:tRNA pseudouridine55 synthase